ncbi:unnamed protein product [Hermetia illucens]|uniref:Peptidase S1 domain-containing protein n=1 Tax=Hermetia illucens TaxID=343691 RepID=A0A7R8YT90_HERIL|nr:venom protease-like [Hermetia illucens]CAD7084467.1 unnamed protein product [Hermetia illucens]
MGSKRAAVEFLVAFLLNFLLTISGQDSIYYPLDNEKSVGEKCIRSDGLSGICENIENCPQKNVPLQNSDFCSFSCQTVIYCCPEVLEKIEKSKTSLRLVEEICEEYYPRDTFEILVVGGERSLPEEHPHMAAIGWSSEDGIDWRCGGSVITNKFIITAAHCTSSRGVQPDIIRTGDLNLLETENDTYPVDFKINGIFVHPQYSASLIYHDIALLKISPEFEITSTTKPACLWATEDIPQQELTALGYGTLEYSGPQANTLYQATIPILPNEMCSLKIPINEHFPNGIKDGQMCALDPNGQKDTCQGDSGGPLQFKHYIGTVSMPAIVGITSFGQYCAGPSPGVYTRVSAYLDWIESVLKADQ